MTTSSWEDYFAALERYKAGEGNGDPNCSTNYVTKETLLKSGKWLANQRMARKGIGTCKISLEQIPPLEELGVWSEQPYTWEEYYAFERYKTGEGNGDSNCPFNYLSKDVPALKLGKRLVHQRSAKRGRKDYKISVERIRLFKELGVWWEKDNYNYNISWADTFRALERYKNGIGNDDPNCPRKYVTDDTPPIRLGNWLHLRRDLLFRGDTSSFVTDNKLAVKKIRRLEELGVWCNIRPWDDCFHNLEEYKAGEGNGDPNCPGNYVTKGKLPLKLGNWLQDQRKAKRGSCKSTHKISDDHIHRLEELGVWWEQPDTWEKYFSALERYKMSEGNGDPNCSINYVTKDTPPLKLGMWLSDRRRSKREGKISSERVRQLDELGIRWEQPDTWEEYFSALVRYKAGDGNGDPNCTRNYVTKDTPPLKLGSWLHCQRSGRKGTRKRKLPVEHIRRLEELGVWWNRNNKGGTPQNLIYE